MRKATRRLAGLRGGRRARAGSARRAARGRGVVNKFPLRISTIRTNNGHEFQSLFHWHVEDLGMGHTYIRVRTPRLNGKVERSHRTDEEEFYQLLTYTGDVDLNEKLEEWQNFYNYHRPHSALAGKTPYEVLREKLNLNIVEAGVE